MQESPDSTISQDSYGRMIEEEEHQMQLNEVEKTEKANKTIDPEEAKRWWISIIGCLENPAEECEQLRQSIVELSQMINGEKDPEIREIISKTI